jgi:hypothetical protein
MRPLAFLRPATVAGLAIGLVATSLFGGCSILSRHHPKTTATAQNDSAGTGEVDVRKYLGPNYCPEVRIFDGAQLIRTYERGHQGDQNSVIWQASFGKTARECLYDAQGGLTLRIGVAGRVITGPKGKPDTITVPIKIAVVKYQDSVLATERFTIPVTVPQQGTALFSQVKEVSVPSPGEHRDYVVYVGFDVGNWDPMHPSTEAIATLSAPTAPAAVETPLVSPAPPPPAAAAHAPPPAKTAQPTNELPVPAGGFVLQ